MIFFRNDYGQGAHEKVLEALIKTNREATVGYGEDAYCAAARALIRAEIGAPDADVYFIPGGTQTNLLMIGAALRPHEAVLSAATGHINVHETGAIEATGHKVLAIDTPDGKLTPALIDPVLRAHKDAHMVKPRMVYLSDATELGTIYTKAELEVIYAYCRAQRLYLFLDGARLGSALTAEPNDLTMADIARLTDCFYIGGTKNGALMGEALVITRPELKEDFPYHIKQRGALFAKGRLLGVQFQALFEDKLFYAIGRHENEMAARLKAGLTEAGYRFQADSPTNQLFPLVTEAELSRLREGYAFEVIDDTGALICIRFVTSWATTAEEVDALIGDMAALRRSPE